MDPAARHVAHRGAHQVLVRQRQPAGALVGRGHVRDALRERRQPAVGFGGVVIRRERQREEAAERPREGKRVVGDPVPGAEDRVVGDAIDPDDSRREQRLAHLDAEILRDLALATEQDRRTQCAAGVGRQRRGVRSERARAGEVVGA